MRHVLAFVCALADGAALQRGVAPVAAVRLRVPRRLVRHADALCEVPAPARPPREQRRGHQRRHQRDQRRPGLRHVAEQPQVRRHRHGRRDAHRAHADRVDVAQVGAAELDALRTQSQRLVDDQVRHHRHHPADGDVGVQAQHVAERLEHVQLHQHQRDAGVEDDPDHAARVAVRHAGKEVGPCQRSGVGVGHVDLELRDDDEQRRGGHRPAVVGEDVLVGSEVHLVRIDRPLHRHHVANRQIGQQRPAQHLQHARHHPAWPARDHASPPAPAVLAGLLRHEAQKVGLLAHLRDQRDAHRHRRTEGQRVERRQPALAPVADQPVEHARVLAEHEDVGRHQHQHPQRLRPHLQPADHRHPVRHQRQHHGGADQVAPGRWNVEGQLQRIGHHRRFEGKEEEGEARVDERGDSRADVAEAGTTGQQVHVHAVTRGVDADRQARQRDDQPRRQNRQRRVGETVAHQQRGPHRLQHEEGRRAAERRVRHPANAPAPGAARGEAQRVVFQRLAGDPGVVVAADLDDALLRLGRRRGGTLRVCRGWPEICLCRQDR